MTPTLYLANFASLRKADPAVVGTGRRWTAMARPRWWERGEGRIDVLCPNRESLVAAKAGDLAPEQYFEHYRARLARWGGVGVLDPGRLCAEDAGGWIVDVDDSDFIGCACARDAALRGECHLFHAAPFLVRAGWRVVLHGVEWPPPA